MSLETMPDEAFDEWAVRFDKFLFMSLNVPSRFFLDTGHSVLCFSCIYIVVGHVLDDNYGMGRISLYRL